MAGIDAGEQVVDWGHLDALFEEFLPTTKVKERNLGFEQIATIEVKITYLKERLEFAHLKNSKYLTLNHSPIRN